MKVNLNYAVCYTKIKNPNLINRIPVKHKAISSIFQNFIPVSSNISDHHLYIINKYYMRSTTAY